MEQDNINEEIILKRAYLWNSVSGLLNAVQSAIILFFIVRFIGIDAGGIFSIAFSYANLFYTMGKYGVRNYQVTDIDDRFSFKDYFVSRVITVVLVIIISLFFATYKALQKDYTVEKSVVVLLICFWKYIDCMEDVVYGMYQQKGRLDIGARNYSIRIVFSTALFCLLASLRISLIISVMVVFITSSVFSFLIIKRSFSLFATTIGSISKNGIKQILVDCFPLFLGVSLSVFFGNLPKYLIDAYLEESSQTYFNIIMMPAFVIQVMSQFIYQPLIKKLAVLWKNNDIKAFVRIIGKQYLYLFAITILVLAGGAVIGIPALSFVYGADLSMFYTEFLLLLVGGGLFAVCNFVIVPLTTIRSQRVIAIGFTFVSVIGFIVGSMIVPRFGVLGASLLYLILNLILGLFLTISLFVKIKIRGEQ